jgi:hypothetical protein
MVALTKWLCLFSTSNRYAMFYGIEFIDFVRIAFVGKLTKQVDGYNTRADIGAILLGGI